MGLREEKEFYELKLAISSEPITTDTCLYSYFPTSINLRLPYIIHGTFDLDSTRNNLNITDKNKIVLTKLVHLIIDTAKYCKKKGVNWFPLEMLINHLYINGRLKELEYYSQLDNAIQKEKVWPCLDGKYRSLNDVVYLNNAFSQFIKENGFSRHYPNMLIPKGNIRPKLGKYNVNNSINGASKKINQISKKITSIEVRATFIKLVCEANIEVSPDLLINKYNKIIKCNKQVYSPAKDEIQIPEFCRITIINKCLYDQLIDSFDLHSMDNIPKSLAKKLEPIIELLPFNALAVAKKIISATSQQIKRNPKSAKEKVLSSIKALWNNYQLSNNIEDLQEPNVPLINAKGNISMSSDLFLSEAYLSGQLTHRLFGQVYPKDSFLASPDKMGLEGDKEDLDKFFLWLGVNHLTKWEQVEYNSQKEKKGSAVLSKIIKDEVGDNINEFHYQIKYESIYMLD
jgi:hypothetical protein